MLRDGVELVRGDHEQADASSSVADFSDGVLVVDLGVAVELFVEACAQKVEALCDAVTHDLGVLADACGEHDRVDAAHDRSVSADVLTDLMTEDLDRHATCLVAFSGALLDVTHVIANARQALEARLAVEHRVDFVGAHALFAHQVEQDTSVDIAAARAHHDAFQRGHPHRGLDRAAILDRGDAASAAEVAGDDAEVADIIFEEVCGFLSDVGVRGAVEAVSADAMLLRDILWDRVGLRAARERPVECGVEDGDVTDVGEELSGDADAREVCGVVQWRQRNERLDRVDHVVGDARGRGEFLAAMHDAVPDAVELDVTERCEHLWDARLERGFGVCGACDRLAIVDPGLRLAFLAEAFCLELELAGAGFVVDDSGLDRRAAAVDHQNMHGVLHPCVDPERMGSREFACSGAGWSSHHEADHSLERTRRGNSLLRRTPIS